MTKHPLDQDAQVSKSPTERGYRLVTAQFLPLDRDKIFEFFSDAFQLETITPPWLHFHVLTAAPIDIKKGTKIDYKLRLHGIPLRWQSLISTWEPPIRFVDEQLRGPYRRWHHEHVFEEVDGGTLCRDIVDYESIGGAIVNSLFVQPDLIKIFRFRQEKLRAIFSNAS